MLNHDNNGAGQEEAKWIQNARTTVRGAFVTFYTYYPSPGDDKARQ